MKEYEAAFQNQPVDVSEEFTKQQNHFFVGSVLQEFDPQTASGKILWRGIALKQRVSYHQLTLQFEDYKVGRIHRRKNTRTSRRSPSRSRSSPPRRCAFGSPPMRVGSTTNPPSCSRGPLRLTTPLGR